MIEAQELCRNGMDKTQDDFIKTLLAAELHWVHGGDCTCHTVEEALKIR